MSNEILVERKASPMKLEVLGVYDWPIWRKEASKFDWSYAQQETCYILRGKFIVTPEGGEPQAVPDFRPGPNRRPGERPKKEGDES